MVDKSTLDALVKKFEQKSFIASDPISIPHGFDDPRDIEVIGLYAASLAWGQRVTILNKMNELCERMDYKPYDFVMGFEKGNRASRLEGFKHRTFQPVDAYWFTKNLSSILRKCGSVESAFSRHIKGGEESIEGAIQGFSTMLLNADPNTPARLSKHLARPQRGSACKRLNMYLRWMVRSGPVDFGLWKSIETRDLLLPLDVHSGTQARKMGYLTRKQNDWKATLELARNCRQLDPNDPSKYDFAFYGSGVFKDSLQN